MKDYLTESASFADALTDWYAAAARDLPWRKTRDPYRIWISEIMLQQTQVATVIPYYNRFTERFGDVEALDAADLTEVYKYWEGLGYYRRAAHLKAAAHVIVTDFDGRFPEKYEDILRLPGIGTYTAAAISSIAFGNPAGVVDGNILRILSRLSDSQDNIALQAVRERIQNRMNRLITFADPSAFNQGMMDLGATICTPSNPKCTACPVCGWCAAHAAGTEKLLPVNIKKRDKDAQLYMTGVLYLGDRLMLARRTEGLLDGLYALVQFPAGSPEAYEQAFEEAWQAKVRLTAFEKEVRHIFTHRVWYMQVYRGQLDPEDEKKLSGNLFTPEELLQLPIPTAHKKILHAMGIL